MPKVKVNLKLTGDGWIELNIKHPDKDFWFDAKETITELLPVRKFNKATRRFEFPVYHNVIFY